MRRIQTVGHTHCLRGVEVCVWRVRGFFCLAWERDFWFVCKCVCFRNMNLQYVSLLCAQLRHMRGFSFHATRKSRTQYQKTYIIRSCVLKHLRPETLAFHNSPVCAIVHDSINIYTPEVSRNICMHAYASHHTNTVAVSNVHCAL